MRATNSVPFMGLSRFVLSLPQGLSSSIDVQKKVVTEDLHENDNYFGQLHGDLKKAHKGLVDMVVMLTCPNRNIMVPSKIVAEKTVTMHTLTPTIANPLFASTSAVNVDMVEEREVLCFNASPLT